MSHPSPVRARMRADTRGSLNVILALGMVTFLAIAGLAFDGAQALASRREASDVAFAAARSGAQAAQAQTIGGEVALDTSAAVAAATATATAEGWPSVLVTVNGPTVTVSVTGTVNFALLPLIGVNGGTIKGSSSATATWGVTDAGS